MSKYEHKSDFLGRLRPRQTWLQKPSNTLGVEESSCPRRVLHFYEVIPLEVEWEQSYFPTNAQGKTTSFPKRLFFTRWNDNFAQKALYLSFFLLTHFCWVFVSYLFQQYISASATRRYFLLRFHTLFHIFHSFARGIARFSRNCEIVEKRRDWLEE